MGTKKVFVVTADFELDTKPEWLDGFRAKYDEPYPYHITLKTPTFVAEADIGALAEEVQGIVETFKGASIAFNRYSFDETDKGRTIMVLADKDDNLSRFQRTVRERLAHYGSHTKPHYKKFEKNFNPHICIARHLDDKTFERAKQELKEPILCKTVIEEVVLTVANSSGFEDMSHPIKKVTYSLS